MAAVAALGEANARYFRTDVTDEDGVVANVAAAKEFLGGLNATINCAGILGAGRVLGREAPMPLKNFSTTVMVNLRSEEHTSELQSLMRISYAVFCLKKKKRTKR